METYHQPENGKDFLREVEVAEAVAGADWIMIRRPHDDGLHDLVRVRRVIRSGLSTIIEVE